MKTALILVTLGVFHPGLALLVVGFVTMGFAVQLAMELASNDEGLEAKPVRVTQGRYERLPDGRNAEGGHG